MRISAIGRNEMTMTMTMTNGELIEALRIAAARRVAPNVRKEIERGERDLAGYLHYAASACPKAFRRLFVRSVVLQLESDAKAERKKARAASKQNPSAKSNCKD